MLTLSCCPWARISNSVSFFFVQASAPTLDDIRRLPWRPCILDPYPSSFIPHPRNSQAPCRRIAVPLHRCTLPLTSRTAAALAAARTRTAQCLKPSVPQLRSLSLRSSVPHLLGRFPFAFPCIPCPRVRVSSGDTRFVPKTLPITGPQPAVCPDTRASPRSHLVCSAQVAQSSIFSHFLR